MTKYIKFEDIENLYLEASDYIKNKYSLKLDAALITGSGIDTSKGNWNILYEIPYNKIPGFPESTVAGHAGKFMIAEVANHKLAIFAGRFHIYEGRSIEEIVSPVLVSHHLGIKNIIITNAAGGLNPKYQCGDIMLIADSINFTSRLIKCDIYYMNGKYPVYFSPDWLEATELSLTENKIEFKTGVYVAVTGPNYETKSEIRMFRKMFADAIGMSTVHESAAAYFSDMNVLAFSVITNKLSDTSVQQLTHDVVLSVSQAVSEKTINIIECALKNIK